MISERLKNLLSTTNNELFEELVWQVFNYQAKNCAVYSEFLHNLGVSHTSVNTINDIPFLPITFFKTHTVTTGTFTPEAVFESSGTTEQTTGKHYVKDLSLYKDVCLAGFKQAYGNPQDYCILALLPSYLERGNSSLVYMVDYFIKESNHPNSGFYLNNYEELSRILKQNETQGIKTLLLGVSFALLDLAEQYPQPLNNTIVMETGGMKGKRKELTREELHAVLTQAFKVPAIHSEYGMTELLSQGYSKGKGIFYPTPSMRVYIRDVNDPLQLAKNNKSGGINIIDLANINSCSFIATSDLGKLYPDGSFEVLGRYDHSDTRGCNLMVL